MKMNEEEMKTKEEEEEEEEEHLTRFHLQVRKKTETLLGPCGVWKGVRGVRGVRGRVRAESAWGPWSLWSPWGPWSPWSPRALWARIGPIPESEVKIHKKRFQKKVPTGFPRYPKLHGTGSRRVRKSRFFKIPKVTYIVQVPTNFPSKGSQIKVPTRFPRFAELHRAGSHKSSKSRFPTKYRFFSK